MDNIPEPEPLKFPVDFRQCPSCGSTRRLAQTLLEEEHRRGKVTQSSLAFVAQFNSLIAPPNMQFITATALITFMDICVDCGTLYCIHAEAKQVAATTKISAKDLAQFHPH